MSLNTTMRKWLGPVFFTFIMPFSAYFGYFVAVKRSGGTPLPFNATVWAICVAIMSYPNPVLNFMSEYLLLRALGDYSNLWVLGIAYFLSIPVNLWAISRITQRTDEGSSALAKLRKATRQVLKSPANQALALFHYKGFGLSAADFSVSGVLLGLLVDLSSSIAHLIIMKFVFKWLFNVFEDHVALNDMDPRTRVAFLSVTVAELASMILLEIQQATFAMRLTDAEKAEKLANEQEETWSDEKAGSSEA